MKTRSLAVTALLIATFASGAYAETTPDQGNANSHERRFRNQTNHASGAQNIPTNSVGAGVVAPVAPPTTVPISTKPAPVLLTPLPIVTAPAPGTISTLPTVAPTLLTAPLTPVNPVVAPITPPLVTAMPILPVITPPVVVVPPPPIVFIPPPIIQIPIVYIPPPPPPITVRTTTIRTTCCLAVSDRRLKMNIHRIGTHPLGIGIYEFDYVWGEHAIGVMADEVRKVRPDAVIRGVSGYDRVDYSKLN